jgi:T5SS/PEP-CTERM-associated repeat protein
LNLTKSYQSVGTEIGVNNGAKGTLVLDGADAAWRDTGDVVIGKNGDGEVRQSGGDVDVSGKITLGKETGSNGVYTFSGGTLKAGALEIGGAGNGLFEWTGGALQTPEVVGNLHNQGGTLQVLADVPMTIVGNYSQTSSGTMRFTLKANSQSISSLSSRAQQGTRLASTGVSLLSTTGTIEAGDGVLNLVIDDFNPVPNTVITVFSPPPSGVFSVVNLPELDSRLAWDQSTLYTAGTLSIVASGRGLLASRPLNAPNPFKLSEGSMLGYYLNEATDVELRVYRSSGNEVLRTTFAKDTHEGAKAGYNRVMLTEFMFGQRLSAGIYPYLLIANSKVIGKGKFAIIPE